MSKKPMSLHKIGPILDDLVLSDISPKHPSTDATDEVKGAYTEGVCGMLTLLGYDENDIENVVPRLLHDRLRTFTPESLAYEREQFTTALAKTHPEIETMALAKYRELLEVMLPNILAGVEYEDDDDDADEIVEETYVEEVTDDGDEIEDVETTLSSQEAAEDKLIEERRIREGAARIGRDAKWGTN